MGKILKVIFGGITIGITFLMLGYVCIYYIAGEETFLQDISQLGQIKILQSQLVISGISGTIILLGVYYFETMRKNEKKSEYKKVLGISSLLIAAIVAMLLISRMNKNIADIMIIIEVTLFAVYCLLNCVREFFDEFIINKKIKEKNNQ